MLRVILADDEQYERDYIEKVVGEGYPGLLEITYKAVDGMDLMEKLEKCKPHIVLLDIKMPRMDGFKTAEEIRKKYPDTQIVIISAYSDFSYAKQAIQLGVTDYLLKPYLDSELRETLDKVILRVREREDSLSMLSYAGKVVEQRADEFDFYQDIEKDLLWNVFLRRRKTEDMEQKFALWKIGKGWFKVVLIISPALITMGGFSQEVLKNYFHMSDVIALNSIWMNQMVICLFSPQPDAFTELTGCINRARKYLEDERKIPVACGVSGAYKMLAHLPEAYDEAAAFIREYTNESVRKCFDEAVDGMKRICELEDGIISAAVDGKRNESSGLFAELVEEIERHLEYQDMAVKLNFGRSLMTIIRGINQIPGVRLKTAEAVRHFDKLKELNFDGDNLKYHVDYFAGIEIERD